MTSTHMTSTHKRFSSRINSLLAVATALATACAVLIASSSALADTLHMKDGRTLEGAIVREGEGYIYFKYKIAGIEQTTVFLISQISRIDRDDTSDGKSRATPAKPAVPEPAQSKRTGRPADAPTSAGTMRIAFITLGDPPHDEVGPYLNAKALRESVKRLEDDQPDVVVLRIKSGGGALAEVPKLANVIQKQLKTKYRVVGWIESAISAAALTADNLEELYFMKKGNFGGVVAYIMTGQNQAEAAVGADLEHILALGEQFSKNGKHNPLIMRAMQTPTDLSCDIDERGVIHWRNDLEGKYIVSRKEGNHILTFNSIDAMKYGLGTGIADTRDELAKLLGADEWVEVGKDADHYQQEFRKNVADAELNVVKLFQQLQLALKSGRFAKAKQYLGQIRGWVRRAPSLVDYGAGGATPPLTPKFFRSIDKQIDDLRRKSKR